MTIKLMEGAGIAKGELGVVTIPTKAQVNKYVPWSGKVTNIGGFGLFGIGVVNTAGNPGNMTFKLGGKEMIIAPNRYINYYHTDPMPTGAEVVVEGEIKFSVIGTYNIKVWALHEDAGRWYYDEELVFNTVVTEESVEKTFWEKLKAYTEENPLQVAVAVGVVAGGALVWQKKQK